MHIKDRKPKDRPGFVWEFHKGCDCNNCPWGDDCRGRIYPHWKERKLEVKKEP